MSAGNIIAEGDYVIAKSETAIKAIKLVSNKCVYFGKQKMHMYRSIGCCYGSFFKINRDGTLELQQNPDVFHVPQVKTEDDDVKDNRTLFDSGESQKLTTNDIEDFKAQGLSGHEMVKIITENSSSFKDKSLFSQEKYMRKKQLKYSKTLQILKPSARLLAEMYYLQYPLKICNLRIDSLSQMLSFCNVTSGCKFIVADGVLGLLTASVLERLGNSGCVVQLHFGSFSVSSQQQAVNDLNFRKEQLQSMQFNIDFQEAMSLLEHRVSGGEESYKDRPETDSAPAEKCRKLERQQHIQQVREILSERNMDGLLVAMKHHPINILPIIDYLESSRPFAIFSMYQAPLVDCYVTLKAQGNIILLNITETWLRKYQVLPDRTHPDYTMSGNGGFLLTGIKVENKSTKANSNN